MSGLNCVDRRYFQNAPTVIYNALLPFITECVSYYKGLQHLLQSASLLQNAAEQKYLAFNITIKMQIFLCTYPYPFFNLSLEKREG